MIVALRMLMAIACIVLSSASLADSVFLDDLTWTELRARIGAGATTIIVPIGGTEQSGPHIALGKHNARVKRLSEMIARRLGNALVAPVVAYVPEGTIDPPTAHMRFPGTITVPPRTFESLLESAAESFRLHGFRDIVFLGDHGGYQKNEQAVAARLNREWGKSPARAHAIVEFYRLAANDYPALLRRQGYRDAEIGAHGGLADTSLTLALDPSSVRTDVMTSRDPGRADGVDGDPGRSSAALGQAGVDVIVAGTADAIRTSIARR